MSMEYGEQMLVSFAKQKHREYPRTLVDITHSFSLISLDRNVMLAVS